MVSIEVRRVICSDKCIWSFCFRSELVWQQQHTEDVEQFCVRFKFLCY